MPLTLGALPAAQCPDHRNVAVWNLELAKAEFMRTQSIEDLFAMESA